MGEGAEYAAKAGLGLFGVAAAPVAVDALTLEALGSPLRNKEGNKTSDALNTSFFNGLKGSLPGREAEIDYLKENSNIAEDYERNYYLILTQGEKVSSKGETTVASMEEVIIAMNMMLAQGRGGNREAANKAWIGFKIADFSNNSSAKLLQGVLENNEYDEVLFPEKVHRKAFNLSDSPQEPPKSVQLQGLLQSIQIDSGMLKVPCQSQEALVRAVKTMAMDESISTVTIDLAERIEVGGEKKPVTAEVMMGILEAIKSDIGASLEELGEDSPEAQRLMGVNIDIGGGVGVFSVGELLSKGDKDFDKVLEEKVADNASPRPGYSAAAELFGIKRGLGLNSAFNFQMGQRGWKPGVLESLMPKNVESLQGRDKVKPVDRKTAVLAMKKAVLGVVMAARNGGGVAEARENLRKEREAFLQIEKNQEDTEGLFVDLIRLMKKDNFQELEKDVELSKDMVEVFEEVAQMSEEKEEDVIVPVKSLKDQIKDKLLAGESLSINPEGLNTFAQALLKGIVKDAYREALNKNSELKAKVQFGKEVINQDSVKLGSGVELAAGSNNLSVDKGALLGAQGSDDKPLSAVELVGKFLAAVVSNPSAPQSGPGNTNENISAPSPAPTQSQC